MSDAPPARKGIKVHVLRCGAESCNALLPLEETDEGLLLGSMIDVAERDGDVAFFPCPRCGGRNLVEEVVVDGKKRSRICGFAAA